MGPFNRYVTLDPQARGYWPTGTNVVPQLMGFGEDAAAEVYISGADAQKCVGAVKESGEVVFVGKGAEQVNALYSDVTMWKWIALAGIPAGLVLGVLAGRYIGKH